LIRIPEEKLKAFFKNSRWLLIIAAIIVILDQVSKLLVRTYIPLGSSWSPWSWLAPFARLIHWTNTGVAFGMFQGKSLVFAILAALVAGAIIYYFQQVPKEDKVLRFALSMMLGGAVGNLIDRLFNGGEVTDFISVGNFAVFNVADSFITVGVLVLLLGIYLEDRCEKEQKKLAQAAEQMANNSDRTPLE
jgi:signal peptidase II